MVVGCSRIMMDHVPVPVPVPVPMPVPMPMSPTICTVQRNWDLSFLIGKFHF